MLNEKILELKKQTEKYIYEKNIDVYIKLQTLYEYIIKDYAKTGDTEVKVIDLIKEYIPDDFKYKEDVIENVKTINKYANAGVKHFNEMKVTYEHKPSMTFIGFSALIRPEEGYLKCPEFWDREYAR